MKWSLIGSWSRWWWRRWSWKEGEILYTKAQKIKLRKTLWWYFVVICYKSPLEIIFLALKINTRACALGVKETKFQITHSFCYIYKSLNWISWYLMPDLVHGVRGEGRDCCGIRRTAFRIAYLICPRGSCTLQADLKKVNGSNREERSLKGAEANNPIGLYAVSWECMKPASLLQRFWSLRGPGKVGYGGCKLFPVSHHSRN